MLIRTILNKKMGLGKIKSQTARIYTGGVGGSNPYFSYMQLLLADPRVDICKPQIHNFRIF